MSIPPADLKYSLPWTALDTKITWLEPTKECNMRCTGCFSTNNSGEHKPLGAVLAEIDAIKQKVNADVIAVAGGDPLCYPHLPEVIRYIKQSGFHPFLVTNGELLTPALLASYKAEGLAGVCLHVDSLQNREGWTGKDEAALNPLRQRFAEMVRAAGGLSCYFNMTVNKSNLASAGAVYDWARANSGLVQLMIFIAFKIPEDLTGERRAAIAGLEVKSGDIIAALAAQDKTFKISGTVRSPFTGVDKWSVAAAFCGRGGEFISPALLAASQELSRSWRGRYLGRLRKLAWWEGAAAAALLLSRGVAAADAWRLRRGVQAIAIVQPETIIWNQKPRFFL